MAQVTNAEQTLANRFVVFARDFVIIWVKDPQYWKWTYEQQASGAFVEVAELLEVCWFDVKVKFNTKSLTPGISYCVFFIIKLTDEAAGWEVPVNMKLVLPNGQIVTHKEDFKKRTRNKWIRIPAGEFKLDLELEGDMEIAMLEISDHWKKGLLLNAVDIQPACLNSADIQPVQ